MITILAWTTLGPSAQALEHTAGLRYRYAWLPSGILDIGWFDSDDEGALAFDRPKVKANIFGLDYELAMDAGGGPGFVFWFERMPFNMDAGYWDDKESPAEHNDGDWLQPEKGLGTWNLGANYQHELPLMDTTGPVWVSLVVGGGLGLGVASGSITVWHAGLNEDVVDPSCGGMDIAPDRQGVCEDDGELDLPGVIPILDITIGTKVHISEYASVRLEFGLHDMLFFGLSGGGSF